MRASLLATKKFVWDFELIWAARHPNQLKIPPDQSGRERPSKESNSLIRDIQPVYYSMEASERLRQVELEISLNSINTLRYNDS